MLENINNPKFIYLFHFIYLNQKVIYIKRLKYAQLIYIYIYIYIYNGKNKMDNQ